MKYTVYKTTNKHNDKIYIGTHQTTNPHDSYLGSGNILRMAINKYGTDGFTKEILEVFDNPKDMFAMERKLVNEEFVARKDTYNISLGGCGGNKLPSGHWTKSAEQCRKISPFNVDNPHPKAQEWAESGLAKARARRVEMLDEHGGLWYSNNGFAGKVHSEETKTKMSISHKGKHDGKKNSQYGTCWVYSLHEKKSIKIKKHEIDKYVSAGWVHGRKIVFD